MKYTPIDKDKKTPLDTRIEEMIDVLWSSTMNSNASEKKKLTYRKAIKFYDVSSDEIEAFEKYWQHNKDTFFKLVLFKDWLQFHRSKNRDRMIEDKEACLICQDTRIIEFEKPDNDGVIHLISTFCKCLKDYQASPHKAGIYVKDLQSLEKSWEGSGAVITDSYKEMIKGKTYFSTEAEKNTRMHHIRFAEDFIKNKPTLYKGLRKAGYSIQEIANTIYEHKEYIPEAYLELRKGDNTNELLSEIVEGIFQSAKRG